MVKKLKSISPNMLSYNCTILLLYGLRSLYALLLHPASVPPMILGLPFLSHNNIVVDASARSAINKNSSFDLLNPVLHKIPVPKKKLKEFFKELKQDRKLLVAELNMVCTERRCRIKHKFEPVKPFDIVGAMRGRIKVLAAQEKL
jgi:hypothetical protein